MRESSNHEHFSSIAQATFMVSVSEITADAGGSDANGSVPTYLVRSLSIGRASQSVEPSGQHTEVELCIPAPPEAVAGSAGNRIKQTSPQSRLTWLLSICGNHDRKPIERQPAPVEGGRERSVRDTGQRE